MTPCSKPPSRRTLCLASLALFLSPAAAARPRADPESADALYEQRADVQAFAAAVAARRQLPAQWVGGQLARARRVERVRMLVMPPPPGVPKNWQTYRERFVEPQRIAAGTAFWSAQRRWLERAVTRYGVPAEIVAAIVGVETFYGRTMGEFPVIDALATLAFDFPPGRSDRSAFFRDELEEYFVWCARDGLDPLAQKGSYAGASGLPQFMPSSINRYAVDFDEDGRVDLRNSPADAIGSVARYLAEFGWTAGQQTHYSVEPPGAGADLARLREPDIRPSFSAARMAELGLGLPAAALAHEGDLALVELENGGASPTYVAGTSNFYVITRYNKSSYYAMAVVDLAQALKSAL